MKSVLITGGTGSFGQAFTKRLLTGPVERVAILSRGEYAQAEMAEKFNDTRIRFFVGDVRDKDRLRWAFEGVDTIIHAAALKRIEVGHYNPMEMVKTNVIGTMNVVESALASKARRVVFLSSDKAWQPISAYGQSKALAETLILNANNQTPAGGPSFRVVRYGNVAGSRGSVIPKWKASSGVVTVTDPDCTRFYMRMDEAVDLVMAAAKPDNDKPILIPELPAFRLGDLADVLKVKMDVTGLPPWEKKHEGMDFGNTSDVARRMTRDELVRAVEAV
jgi:UDP-N-acetylglucosamine 4,6-dehydratase/5-epimerase